MAVKHIPASYHSITPYLILSDAVRGLEFYKRAFGAVELLRLSHHSGKVSHAEIRIGDSVIMLADEFPDIDAPSPITLNGTTISLMIYVEDVDLQFDRAVKVGAIVRRPVRDQFYRDRNGILVDPFGHVWTISTHKEDLTPDEIKERAAALMG